jgi:hypothetical protein
MNIPPFPRKIEIPDLENFFRTRVSTTVVMWPEQALPLLCFMCFPNDEAARDDLLRALWSWQDTSEPPATLDKLGRIQADWLKVADIFHLYCDLIGGRHQERRGAPSIGKAITLASANAKNWGTGKSKLWELWTAYKDVAHLVTAASLVRREVRNRYSASPPGPLGLNPTQFVPFQMAMLMPDLVLAVATEFERYGLGSEAHPEPAFDLDALWRIPADINVAPFPPLVRKLSPQDFVVLNARRAGNRGRAKPKAE